MSAVKVMGLWRWFSSHVDLGRVRAQCEELGGGGFQVMASVQFRCRMTSQLESNGNGQFSTVMSMKLYGSLTKVNLTGVVLDFFVFLW